MSSQNHQPSTSIITILGSEGVIIVTIASEGDRLITVHS